MRVADLASTASWSMPRSRWSSRSPAAHEVRIGTSTSGCSWTPHARGPNRASCSSPSGVSARATAPSGSPTTTSLFHCTPRTGPSPATRSSSAAAGSQPTSNRPTCWPRGVGRHVAAEGGRRAAGGPGRCRAWARRRRRRRAAAASPAPASGAARRRRRPSSRRAPPARRTTRGPGSSSPAHGRHTSSAAPASVSQVPTWAGGHWPRARSPRMRVTVVAAAQMTGSIRSRSYGETWTR